jgi:hypothetical protein
LRGQGDGDVDWQLSTWLRRESQQHRIASGSYAAKKILMRTGSFSGPSARRLVQEDQVWEFHFMLYEYNARYTLQHGAATPRT